MTELRPGLDIIEVKSWENKHENFVAKFSNPVSYQLKNPLRNSNHVARYNATTENMQALIDDAINRNIEVRAIGKGWSFTKVAIGANGFIDTLALRLAFGIPAAYVHQDFTTSGNAPEDVRFFQCGNSVLAINSLLEKRLASKRSILASGASNGQTIAGATSTGTHGGAFETGAVHDSIVGLHVVVGPNRHVYIEKASEKVVNHHFIDLFKIDEHIVDDDIFNSAVVGLGSFGIIHGIMLRTAPIFLLEKYRVRTEWTSQLKNALSTLDFAAFNLIPPQNAVGASLYHFQVIINPYNIDPGDTGVYLTYIYKIPYRTDYISRTLKQRGFTYGDDTLAIVGGLLSNLPIFRRAAIKFAVNNLINIQYPNNQIFPWIGTMGETFTYTKLRGKTASSGIAVDHSNASKSVEIILDVINNVKPFIGVIAMRYVKGTDAKLGFTKFPITCVIELDGAEGAETRAFLNLVCDRLTNANISFTMHWGKINDYVQNNPLSQFYDQQNIDDWKASRTQVFQNNAAQRVFENDFIRNCGLTT